MCAIKCQSVVFILCLIVLSTHVSTGQQNETDNSLPVESLLSQTLSPQIKFIWYNEKTPIPPNDPCATYNPPVPDFRAPGRRISVIKCFEYIWQVKLRDVKAERLEKCRHIMPVPGVIGGHPTKPGEFPSMGAIGWKLIIGTWKFMCGSTIISPKFVLTAAHCSRASVNDMTLADTVPKIVRLGRTNIADFDERNADDHLNYDVNIIKVIVHPRYKSPKQYFDIALMKLEQELLFSAYMQPACIWSKHKLTESIKRASVAGWGATECKSQETSPELLTAEVDIIDSGTCDGLLRRTCNRNWCGLKKNQLCAGNLSGGVDTLQGDSGGPLLVNIPLPITTQGHINFVVGITAFGKGCGTPNLPGVYTHVASFVDWIECHVWPGRS